MITNYNQFLDNKLNEGLWGSLKNLFGKLLQNVSDELKKPVDELTNKLSKTKDTKQIKNIIYNYLKVHNTTLTNSLKNTKDVATLKRVIIDNLSAMYASITAQVQSLGEENYSFSEIFADSPKEMKELFDKNSKKFNNKIIGYVDRLVQLQGKPFGYTEDELKVPAVEKINESINIQISDRLFEATEVPNVVQGQTDNTQAGQKKKINDTSGVQNSDEEKTPKKDDKLEKLKKAIKTWFDISIYKKMNETLKKETQGGAQGGAQGGTVEDKIKNMTSTENKESVNKIVDALTKTDKEKLKTVRDTVGLNKDSAPL